MKKSGLADSPLFKVPASSIEASPPSAANPSNIATVKGDNKPKKVKKHGTTIPRYHDTMTPRYHDTIIE